MTDDADTEERLLRLEARATVAADLAVFLLLKQALINDFSRKPDERLANIRKDVEDNYLLKGNPSAVSDRKTSPVFQAAYAQAMRECFDRAVVIASKYRRG